VCGSGRDEYESPRPAAHDAFAATQVKLAFKNVEQFLDLGVVVRTRIEPRRSSTGMALREEEERPKDRNKG
jgi:hypothetical protein